MKSIPISYSVFEDNDNPIFGESATHISIDDEAGGGFIVLKQYPDEGEQTIRLTLEEIEEINRLANKLITTYDQVTKKYEIEMTYDAFYDEFNYRFVSDNVKGEWCSSKEAAENNAREYFKGK